MLKEISISCYQPDMIAWPGPKLDSLCYLYLLLLGDFILILLEETKIFLAGGLVPSLQEILLLLTIPRVEEVQIFLFIGSRFRRVLRPRKIEPTS